MSRELRTFANNRNSNSNESCNDDLDCGSGSSCGSDGYCEQGTASVVANIIMSIASILCCCICIAVIVTFLRRRRHQRENGVAAQPKQIVLQQQRQTNYQGQGPQQIGGAQPQSFAGQGHMIGAQQPQMVMMNNVAAPQQYSNRAAAGPPRDMSRMSQLEQVREMARLRQAGQAVPQQQVFYNQNYGVQAGIPVQGIPIDPSLNNMHAQPVFTGGQPQMGQPVAGQYYQQQPLDPNIDAPPPRR